jgi:hypothetical protein
MFNFLRLLTQQLSSIPRLLDTKAKAPQQTLLHYIAEQLETRNPRLLDSLETLSALLGTVHAATLPQHNNLTMQMPKQDMEAMFADARGLADRTTSVRNLILGASDLTDLHTEFINSTSRKALELIKLVETVGRLLTNLADYYVTSPKDAINELSALVVHLIKASKENAARHVELGYRVAFRLEHKEPDNAPSAVDDLLLLLEKELPPGHARPSMDKFASAPKRRPRPSILQHSVESSSSTKPDTLAVPPRTCRAPFRTPLLSVRLNAPSSMPTFQPSPPSVPRPVRLFAGPIRAKRAQVASPRSQSGLTSTSNVAHPADLSVLSRPPQILEMAAAVACSDQASPSSSSSTCTSKPANDLKSSGSPVSSITVCGDIGKGKVAGLANSDVEEEFV